MKSSPPRFSPRSALSLTVLGLACSVGCARPATRPGTDENRSNAARIAATKPIPSGLKEQVESLLSGYEYVPTTEDWKKLGPDAMTVLQQLYGDSAQLPSRRTRAVASLALVDNPDAPAALESLLGDTKQDVALRATAASAYAHRQGASALAKLKPLLEETDPTLRESAIRAVGGIGTDESRRTLIERLGREEQLPLRELIQQNLSRLRP